MRWQKKHTGSGVFDIYYPCFEAGKCTDAQDARTDKRISDAVSRMNGFYLEMCRCASEYSHTLGTGYRYFTDFYINECDGKVTVTVTLRIRHRGRTVAQKKLTHVWSDGVITETCNATA